MKVRTRADVFRYILENYDKLNVGQGLCLTIADMFTDGIISHRLKESAKQALYVWMYPPEPNPIWPWFWPQRHVAPRLRACEMLAAVLETEGRS
jgi:hypothetical protein